MAYPDLVAPLIAAVSELYHKWFDDSQKLHEIVAQQSRKIAMVKDENAKIKTENQAIKAENQDIKARLDHLEKMILSK